MDAQKQREQRINSKIKLDKLPFKSEKFSCIELGDIISKFIHHTFIERAKSERLNWCFGNIKRAKIFLQIFHSNQTGREIYKEEIAKNLPEYSYKTIAKIIDEGIDKKNFILLPVDGVPGNDAKVKNIRPSEELVIDFLNLSIEIISYIDRQKINKPS